MRAVAIKCPNCAATVNAPETASTVTCEYCHTVSRIQRRTLFNRPIPLPKPATPALQQMPVATQKGSKSIFVVILFFFLFPVGIGAFVFLGQKVAGVINGPEWGGTSGLALVDLNGDGTMDGIGRAQVIRPDHLIHICAFDGKTGETIWISDALGKLGDVHSIPLGVAADAVIVGEGGAGIRALNLKDGKTRWRATLNEKPETFCSGADGSIVVKTADKQLHPVSLADGTVGSSTPGETCSQLPTDLVRHPNKPAHLVITDEEIRSKIEGMRVDDSIRHLESPITIGLANKDPGTRVPMLVAYRWDGETPEDPDKLRAELGKHKSRTARRAAMKRMMDARSALRNRVPTVLWRATVPGVDPLSVSEGYPDTDDVDLTPEIVVVVYSLSSGHHNFRATAFNLADGKRKWDVKIPGDRPFSGVRASSTHVFVSTWGHLYALDIETGKNVYTITGM